MAKASDDNGAAKASLAGTFRFVIVDFEIHTDLSRGPSVPPLGAARE